MRFRPLITPLALIAVTVVALLWLAPPLVTAAKAADYPAFPAGATWFNVSRPLTKTELHGRVVLLDFFTPGCINCIHMIPIQQQLKQKFGDDLLVVGVTSPKFSASQQAANMPPFLRRYGIDEPVFIDSGMAWWQHYGVFAWPTMILLGPDGKVVQSFVGERSYAQMAAPIAAEIAQASKANLLTHPPLPLRPLKPDDHVFALPTKVAVDGDRIAISDTGRNQILIYDRAGKRLAAIGSGRAGFSDGDDAHAEFNRPQGLAFAGSILYVADTDNQRIRAIDLKHHRVRTVAGNGQRMPGITGARNPRDIALNSPWALTYADKQLFIAMAGDHQIWRYLPDKNRLAPYAGSGREGLSDGERLNANFAQSSGLAYHAGNLYVADPESSSIRQINLNTGLVITLVGKGLFNFGDQDGLAAQAQLQHPQGVAYLNHALYIADTFNNAIRKLDLDSLQVTTLTKSLAQPNGLAVLDDRHLLVADTNHDRMVTVDVQTGVVTPWPAETKPIAQTGH
ncbi:hypothetical protein A9404_12490 [Halothiobacillus diazotrophicus]|uniref:Thioredoxin domain-containing protein n=2 Tax=Halothiobacillus diazotrophicus TaxID=1860122 RepID=A0A191ZKS7_9GAMM|nr:hypothetical protein A9404_12490 [Halothiobacillus diazotrophicus]